MATVGQRLSQSEHTLIYFSQLLPSKAFEMKISAIFPFVRLTEVFQSRRRSTEDHSTASTSSQSCTSNGSKNTSFQRTSSTCRKSTSSHHHAKQQQQQTTNDAHKLHASNSKRRTIFRQPVVHVYRKGMSGLPTQRVPKVCRYC